MLIVASLLIGPVELIVLNASAIRIAALRALGPFAAEVRQQSRQQ